MTFDISNVYQKQKLKFNENENYQVSANYIEGQDKLPSSSESSKGSKDASFLSYIDLVILAQTC